MSERPRHLSAKPAARASVQPSGAAGSSSQGQPCTPRAKVRQQRGTAKQSPDKKEEEILRKAQVYLLFEAKCPMLWTVAGIREERIDGGKKRWVITMHLRYPTGFEGYLGDVCYDGERFSELTDERTMRRRAEQIAADTEGIREWNEHRAVVCSKSSL